MNFCAILSEPQSLCDRAGGVPIPHRTGPPAPLLRFGEKGSVRQWPIAIF